MFECSLAGLGHWGSWMTAVVFLGAGSLATYLVMRSKIGRPVNTDRIDSLEILKARLAKGDLTLEEYNILKTVL